MALTDEAIEKIRQMIVTGRVRPGEKLPRESDLAAELGLSRSSLREAVRALSLVNVLEVRRVLEPAATALAATRMPEAALAGLTAVLGPAGGNTTPNEFVAAEAEFHRRIAAGSGNPVLASLAESISVPTARARLWRRVTEPGALERTPADLSAYGNVGGARQY